MNIDNNIYLYFEEKEHKYTDSRNKEYLSVTTLLSNYHASFDVNYWAHKKAKEQGKTEAQIKAEWKRIKDEACERGSITHNGIEDAIKDVSKFKEAIKYLTSVKSGRCITVADIPNLLPTPLDIESFKQHTNNKYPEIYKVFEFYINKGYTIYSEIGVFLPDYLVSGTIDILCYRPTDFVILDWKTNRDGLKFESGYFKKDKTTIPNQLTDIWVKKSESMLPPLAHLDNCNGMHYTMQLSLYALMTEQVLNIPCIGLGLCHIGSPWVLNKYGQPYRDKDGYHIDPNGSETVNWYRIDYLRHEAISVLQDRYSNLIANTNLQLSLFD